MVTIDQYLFALALLAALGCGLIAGVFFAFSSFVMKALARLPAGEGITAMQSINIVVLKSWFIAVFMGTAALSVLALIYSLFRLHEPGAIYLLFGSVLYLVGSFFVTIVFNVPRNEALASVAPDDPNSARLWSGYVTSWTGWNHVRTVAALVAAASFSIALAC
ncbi:MAG TPA: anthrone oxygenase family protein [Burkholderiales bacterium]|nr:anthrone oxygenase family protein [Burkholderiales bacterium]